jgi:hypothetical protein
MDRIKEYVLEKYPSRFKNKKIEIIEEDNFFKVFTKDGSPVFLSKNI